MTELNSATKMFADNIVLYNFSQLIHGISEFDNVAILFPEPSDLVKQKYFNAIVTLVNFLSTSLEIFLAVILLIALSPIILLIAVSTKITSRGPIFYGQKRVGKDGHEFVIHKFRTMIQNAEENSGAILSWQGDPRVTGLGSLLRSTHLDELPQLLNVLKSEMSFIGPRPERPEIIRTFENKVSGYDQRSIVLPGITGLAQICCPYDAAPEVKLKYDLYYILNKASLSLNLMILLFTVGKLFSGIFPQRKQLET